jgi:anaerobic selenocysteine-containing dehydrogenase
MSLNRRDFLKIAGVTATSALGFTQNEREILPNRPLIPVKEKWISGGEPSWKNTICLQCEAGCGIMVKLAEEGRAVKIEGNPDFPVNRGGTCPKGQAGLQLLYDPDRLKYPLKRIGPRGEGKWERVSWNEAITFVIRRLKKLREKNEPHTLAIWGSRLRSHTGKLMARFLEAFGSPNLIDDSTVGTGGTLKAFYLTQGIPEFMAYDFENTNYLLSFGTPLLESWRPGVYFLRMYGHLRRGRPGIRVKIVQIDTRFSVSAAKADEWIAIKPGTEGALALGLAHVLIKENLYDKPFVENYTFGFEDWSDENGTLHIGFKTLVLKDYPPEVVSQITGIPVDKITRLAREFATHKPSVAIGERSFNGYTNDLYNQMAIHALNALSGSIDAPGGPILQKQPPLTSFPLVRKDVIAEQGVTKPRIDDSWFVGADLKSAPTPLSPGPTLAENIRNETPYPIQVLFLYHVNPLYDKPNPSRFRQAFEKIPLIISFSSFLDESAAFADLILPDSTFFEKWEDDPPTPGVGYAYLGLRQPVVKPLYDTMNTGDVLIKIANGLDGTVAESFPWNTFEDVLTEGLKGIFETRRGSIVTETLHEFEKKFLEAGGWWDTTYPFGELRKEFPTPSGKFEFYSQILKKSLQGFMERSTIPEQDPENTLQSLGLTAHGDNLFLPHYLPPRFTGEETEYPFYLNPYKPMTLADEMGANQPWLMEVYGTPVNMFWNTWVEINPTTAKKLNLKDQDPVWIESSIGKIKTRVKIYPGAAPDTVNIPFGLGHQAGGRWAQHRGANPNEIIAHDYDRVSGILAWMTTRVKVYKA